MSNITINVNIFKHTDSEIWNPIPGYLDYQASNLGRVKSLKFNKERILKPGRDKDGYLYVVLCNESGKKTFKVHRLVVMAFLGILDDQEIDHINGNPTDNRLKNLRVCSHSDNMRNRRKHKNNSTGYPGVYYHKKAKKYRAQIWLNGRNKHLGYFNTPEEAFTAYKNASLKLHGAFSPFVTRPEFKALAEQVSTFVSKDEFKALEERVSTLERMLNLQGTKNSDIFKGVTA